jgi:hypothetical protein
MIARMIARRKRWVTIPQQRNFMNVLRPPIEVAGVKRILLFYFLQA